MKATVWYKHEAENYASMSPYRKADADEMFVQFLPEGGETLPFPTDDNMIPFADFVQWFNERSAAAEMLTDEQAAALPTLYPIWDGNRVPVYDGTDGTHPQTRVRGLTNGLLYKCRKSHTTQMDWPPEITPDLWAVVDVAHAGTIADPIPAERGMEYEYGKYYLDPEDGKTYLCERGSETGTIVLHYLPHELTDIYFTLVG